MKDATKLFQKYRECARFVWNNFLYSESDSLSESGFDQLDHFREIETLLFRGIVLRCFDAPDNVKSPIFQVIPSAPSVSILIERPASDGNKYWDDPVNRVGADDAEFRFIDYFDWDKFGYIDLQYYRVKIVDFPRHPHLVGREALIEVHHGRIVSQDPDSG